MDLTYESATMEGFDRLVELRIDAMRDSLEASDRFNRERSVERFKTSFRPEDTTLIKDKEKLIGFFGVSEKQDHFYQKNGFVVTNEDEFDIYYERKVEPSRGTNSPSQSNPRNG